jgi:hypothetical protein
MSLTLTARLVFTADWAFLAVLVTAGCVDLLTDQNAGRGLLLRKTVHLQANERIILVN